MKPGMDMERLEQLVDAINETPSLVCLAQVKYALGFMNKDMYREECNRIDSAVMKRARVLMKGLRRNLSDLTGIRPEDFRIAVTLEGVTVSLKEISSRQDVDHERLESIISDYMDHYVNIPFRRTVH